jgi:hypothetical protein
VSRASLRYCASQLSDGREYIDEHYRRVSHEPGSNVNDIDDGPKFSISAVVTSI